VIKDADRALVHLLSKLKIRKGPCCSGQAFKPTRN
jgi:hypothetical protein